MSTIKVLPGIYCVGRGRGPISLTVWDKLQPKESAAFVNHAG